MIAYILTEGRSDAELLKRLLEEPLLAGVEFVTGKGLSSLVSLARSLLVRRRKPLAIVIDADSTDEETVRDRRQSTEEVVAAVAPRVPLRVIMSVPEIEALFFQANNLLEHIIHRQLSAEQLTLARVSPKRVLDQLLKDTGHFQSAIEVLNAATPEQLEVFGSFPPIVQLREFLANVREQDARSKIEVTSS